MARVKRQPVESNPPGYTEAQGWKVQRVDVESTQLIEIGPTWLGWRGQDIDVAMLAKLPLQDAIAKVTPPGGTPEIAVARLEDVLYERGAVMVRVMPSAGDDKVQVDPATEALAQVNKRSLRQVAVERAMRVQAPRDRDALLSLVNEAMDHGEAPCT